MREPNRVTDTPRGSLEGPQMTRGVTDAAMVPLVYP